MPSLSNILMLALLFVTVGFIAGALISTLWADRDRRKRGQADAPVTQSDHTDEVRIWHDLASGRLMAVVGGKEVSDPSRLPADRRRKLIALGREWIAWLGGVTDMPTRPPLLQVEKLAPNAGDGAVVPTGVVPTAAQSAAEMETAGAVAVNEQDVLESRLANAITPGGMGTAGQPASAVSPSQRRLGTPTNQPVEKPKAPASIVTQIDEVLQEMLETSSLQTRAIRLSEDPRKGVIVWVGVEHYDGIDAVKDDEIREFIRKAVKEWERRTEGK